MEDYSQYNIRRLRESIPFFGILMYGDRVISSLKSPETQRENYSDITKKIGTRTALLAIWSMVSLTPLAIKVGECLESLVQ